MELMEYLRFAVALVFVLGLVWACSWFGKRMGLAPRISNPNAVKRLAVIEVQAIDARRKLLLIRRDDKEHLLLLNGDQDLLIEGGFSSPRQDQDGAAAVNSADKSLMSRILPFNGNSKQ